MSDLWSVEVLERQIVGPAVIALTATAPQGFEARPGQFVLVNAGDRGGRHYTISSPNVDDSFEITVNLDARSEVVSWLATRTPGDRIEMQGPFGRQCYGGGDVVAIGGDSGIGAAVGVAERALEGGYETDIVAADRLVHEARLSALATRGAAAYVVREELTAPLKVIRTERGVFVFGFHGFIERVKRAAVETSIAHDPFVFQNYGQR